MPQVTLGSFPASAPILAAHVDAHLEIAGVGPRRRVGVLLCATRSALTSGS